MSDIQRTPREMWLAEYSSEGTRETYARHFKDFLIWAKTTDVELVEEWEKADDKKRWAKDMGATLIRYLAYLKTEALCYDKGYSKVNDPEMKHAHKGMSVNTARNKLIGVMAFFASQCDRVKIKKGAFPRSTIAIGEHEFAQNELKAMFHYGNIREKAVLSTAVSLGWGSGDFLKLKWSDIEAFLVEEPFTGFWHIRKKAGAMARCHLTPEAIISLRKWREERPANTYVFANGDDKPWTNSALNYTVDHMVKKARLEITRGVRFHLFRKFLLRQLSNAGIQRWHVKLMTGKQVPPDILTYLQDNTDQLREEYEGAYPRFSLTEYTNSTAREKLKDLEAEIADLKEALKKREIEASARRSAMDEMMKKLREHDIKIMQLGKRVEEENGE